MKCSDEKKVQFAQSICTNKIIGYYISVGEKNVHTTIRWVLAVSASAVMVTIPKLFYYGF